MRGAISPMSSVARYVDRETGAVVSEQRHDTKVLQYLYSNAVAAWFFRRLARRRLFSRLHGWWYNRRVATRKLEQFVKRFRIDIREAEKPLAAYSSCNEIFHRKLRDDARPVQMDPELLVSPADASVLITPSMEDTRFLIKGNRCTLGALLKDDEQAKTFQGGNIAIFRLAPADYHRFHFPDGGYAEAPRAIRGYLDSVCTQAIEHDPSIFCHNQRDIVQLSSSGFGRMLIIPIGAMLVGRIVETYRAGPVIRGQEQGYFEIGGSSIVMVLKKDKVIFDEDLVANSQNGLETKIKMGTHIGFRKA